MTKFCKRCNKHTEHEKRCLSCESKRLKVANFFNKFDFRVLDYETIKKMKELVASSIPVR